MLLDSTITVKAGEIVDIDEKQFAVLKALNRAIEYGSKPEKKEIAEVKRETRKGKK